MCKAEKWDVAMATSIDDNATDENLDKYMVWLIWERYTNLCGGCNNAGLIIIFLKF